MHSISTTAFAPCRRNGSKCARASGRAGWQVLRYLIIPHIVPYVLMTTKSTVGYAMRMLIFAELIGSAIGIGAQMGLAQATFHMESVIAWTVLLIAINLAAQGTVGLLERYLLRWRDEAVVR